MNFRSYEIKDICKIKSGKRLPKGTDFSEKPTKHKYIRARDIKNGKIDGSDLGYISEETQKKIERYIVNTNDIIITIAGTIGEVALVSKKFDGVNLTENAVRLTEFSKDVCPEFLAYILKSPERKEYMEQVAGGSAQPKLGIYKIEAIKVDLPDVQIQHKIADILSAYDNLIENNQKQIKLLEEAAQRLYKEWFVDLRFPGHENTKIVDGVPEGWNEKILSQVANVIMGQSPKSEFYNSEKKGLPFHQGVGSYGVRFVMDDIYSTSYTRIAEPNSILFSVRAPVGRLNITKSKVVIGRGLAAINQTDGCQSYLYYLLKNRFFKDNIVGNGSIFASVSKDELLNQKFLIPERNLMMQFEKIVSQMDKQIENLDSKNKKLIEARDRLLPKLMSGEVEV